MGCTYCENLFSPSRGSGWDSHDRILFQSEHFVAVPTIGSLVEGWLLIVTKHHHLCMGELAADRFDELDQFKLEVARSVERNYGPVAIFEHGPSLPKQGVGCGVDHAHLHVVPTTCDLVLGLRGVMTRDLCWTDVRAICDARDAFDSGLEYLYVEQPLSHGRIATGHGFESQLFRKVIARYIGEPDRFDWKLYSGPANVRRTVEKFTSRPCQDSSVLAPTSVGAR